MYVFQVFKKFNIFFPGKLEIGLTYVASFYSEHICTRCYYLYSVTLLGLVSISQFVNQDKPTLKKVQPVDAFRCPFFLLYEDPGGSLALLLLLLQLLASLARIGSTLSGLVSIDIIFDVTGNQYIAVAKKLQF